jgi:DNA-directed RNA polymerase II subunit RPB1
MKANAVTLRITEHDAPTRDLLAPEAHQYLEQIPQENVHIFRGHKDDFHPSSLVMTVLPIPPNCVRPSPTIDGDEVRGEDDLTRRLLYILRVAKGYAKVLDESSVIREHAMRRTQDAVHMYIDQKRMSSKQVANQKSIASRLRGKTGRLRGTLMGKRSNFTARTVITGDSMLDMREVGVPQHVADTLTIVENVNRLNYKQLRDLVRTQDKTIKYVIRPDGTRLDMRTIKGRTEQLKQGWSVERTMRNGDPVLFNRQPSLHRMSIMCHRARIMPVGKTFRLNLSCTTPYNADFVSSSLFC